VIGVAQDQEGVRASALGPGEPVRQEHQHGRQDHRFGDAEQEAVRQEQPVGRDHALQRGEHTPGAQRPEQQGLDTAPFGEAAGRHLEQEIPEEEQAAQEASLRGCDVQTAGQAASSADRVVRAV